MNDENEIVFLLRFLLEDSETQSSCVRVVLTRTPCKHFRQKSELER